MGLALVIPHGFPRLPLCASAPCSAPWETDHPALHYPSSFAHDFRMGSANGRQQRRQGGREERERSGCFFPALSLLGSLCFLEIVYPATVIHLSVWSLLCPHSSLTSIPLQKEARHLHNPPTSARHLTTLAIPRHAPSHLRTFAPCYCLCLGHSCMTPTDSYPLGPFFQEAFQATPRMDCSPWFISL